jgi:hypothetical protein
MMSWRIKAVNEYREILLKKSQAIIRDAQREAEVAGHIFFIV